MTCFCLKINCCNLVLYPFLLLLIGALQPQLHITGETPFPYSKWPLQTRVVSQKLFLFRLVPTSKSTAAIARPYPMPILCVMHECMHVSAHVPRKQNA